MFIYVVFVKVLIIVQCRVINSFYETGCRGQNPIKALPIGVLVIFDYINIYTPEDVSMKTKRPYQTRYGKKD